MVKSFRDEKWKEIQFEQPQKLRYAISSYGRIVSFTDDIENGRLLKGGMVKGFNIFRYKHNINGRVIQKAYFVHRLVAEYFIPKNSPNYTAVLHLDHNKLNNHFTNLKWATREEMLKHNYYNPSVVENRRKLLERNRKGFNNRKLTETQVIHIKRLIFNPNRKTRLRIIAKRFGICEMQLYRIKSGENWGHVKF